MITPDLKKANSCKIAAAEHPSRRRQSGWPDRQGSHAADGGVQPLIASIKPVHSRPLPWPLSNLAIYTLNPEGYNGKPSRSLAKDTRHSAPQLARAIPLQPPSHPPSTRRAALGEFPLPPAPSSHAISPYPSNSRPFLVLVHLIPLSVSSALHQKLEDPSDLRGSRRCSPSSPAVFYNRFQPHLGSVYRIGHCRPS